MFFASIPSMCIYVNSDHSGIKDLNSFFKTVSVGNVRSAMQTCDVAEYVDSNRSRTDRIELTFNFECENGILKDITSFGQVPSISSVITCPQSKKKALEAARVDGVEEEQAEIIIDEMNPDFMYYPNECQQSHF